MHTRTATLDSPKDENFQASRMPVFRDTGTSYEVRLSQGRLVKCLV